MFLSNLGSTLKIWLGLSSQTFFTDREPIVTKNFVPKKGFQITYHLNPIHELLDIKSSLF